MCPSARLSRSRTTTSSNIAPNYLPRRGSLCGAGPSCGSFTIESNGNVSERLNETQNIRAIREGLRQAFIERMSCTEWSSEMIVDYSRVSTDGQTLYAQQAALRDTEVVDVFAPPREDFLAGGTPSYMRAP